MWWIWKILAKKITRICHPYTTSVAEVVLMHQCYCRLILVSAWFELRTKHFVDDSKGWEPTPRKLDKLSIVRLACLLCHTSNFHSTWCSFALYRFSDNLLPLRRFSIHLAPKFSHQMVQLCPLSMVKQFKWGVYTGQCRSSPRSSHHRSAILFSTDFETIWCGLGVLSTLLKQIIISCIIFGPWDKYFMYTDCL